MMECSRNLGYWQYSCVLIKKQLRQRQFLEVFRDEIILKETFVMDSYSSSNLQDF